MYRIPPVKLRSAVDAGFRQVDPVEPHHAVVDQERAVVLHDGIAGEFLAGGRSDTAGEHPDENKCGKPAHNNKVGVASQGVNRGPGRG